MFHVVGKTAQRCRGRGQIAQRRVEVSAGLAPARRQTSQVVQRLAGLLYRLVGGREQSVQVSATLTDLLVTGGNELRDTG